MKMLFLLFCLSSTLSGYPQDTILISKVDSPINFFGEKPLRLAGYNNRVIPFNDLVPLYVEITYEESKHKNFEYFRIDSTHYLTYEYFRTDKGSSVDGLKSRGVMRVASEITGVKTTGVKYVGISKGYYTKEIHHFKALSKEGPWEEFEDSVFNHIYWVGNYSNNQRIGLWKRMVYGIGDDYVLEEIDYDKDPTTRLYPTNLVRAVPIDSLKQMLFGRWNLRGCDASGERRMFYSKCELYDGHYGDACNNKFGIGNHYDFISNNKFARQRGEGCDKFQEDCVAGRWLIIDAKSDRFIEIKFTNGRIWKLKILYIDKQGNLVTDR